MGESYTAVIQDEFKETVGVPGLSAVATKGHMIITNITVDPYELEGVDITEEVANMVC